MGVPVKKTSDDDDAIETESLDGHGTMMTIEAVTNGSPSKKRKR